jgi:HSP20 family molecular chaperone IbpA
MKLLWNKPAVVGVATLIIGGLLGAAVATTTLHARAEQAPKQTAKVESKATKAPQTDEWDPFREMERMQEEIDRSIRHATEQFRSGPGFDLMRRDAGYSSSLDLRDRKDHFELRAYLPDAESSDVKVTTEGDNMLRVSVTHRKEEKKEEKGSASSFAELGRYEQLVTLPEPVKSEEMKVDRDGHELVITIPKAKTS